MGKNMGEMMSEGEEYNKKTRWKPEAENKDMHRDVILVIFH